MQTLDTSLKVSKNGQQDTSIIDSRIGAHYPQQKTETNTYHSANKRKNSSITIAVLGISLAALYFFC